MTEAIVLAEQTGCALAVVDPESAVPNKSLDEAFHWAFAASRALPASALVPLNVDVREAPIIVSGALPKIIPFRAQLGALPGFDLTHVDTLAWHTRALLKAIGLYRAAPRGPALVAELVQRVRRCRYLLLQDMSLMVNRGLLPAHKYEKLKGQTRQKDLWPTLLGTIETYRANWNELSAITTVTEEELEQASLTALRFQHALSVSKHRDAELVAANDQRRRNFTLLAHAYDQVRRGLSYLLWNEGTLEKIAPSLYRGRGGSRRKEKGAAGKHEDDASPAPTGASGQVSTIR